MEDAGTVDDHGRTVLRHRDATKQARMYGLFAVGLFAVPVAAFVFDWAGKFWLLALLALALVATVSAVRLATIQVVLDARGVHEPAPLSKGIFTPWDDVKRVRRLERPGAAKLRFAVIEIEHRDGFTHTLDALSISTREPQALATVDGWVATIREHKARFTA